MGLEATVQITVIRIGEKKSYKLVFVTVIILLFGSIDHFR